MDKLYMFQAKFVKVKIFGWWNMERIQTDAGTHFTSKEFQKGVSVHGLKIALEEPHHQ